MKIFEKTATNERVKCIHPIMDWWEDGIVFRWKFLGVTMWKKQYRYPFSK